MIPKIIHYCWFGRGDIPELAVKCIESWHKYMPHYEYKLWNEDNFDINLNKYVKEAYEARKFAFVSDYVRLWVLEREGGLYLDTDVEVYRPFDNLLSQKAFAGFEGSKHSPLGTCVMASEAHGEWVSEMLNAYSGRSFLKADGSYDLTTNVLFISGIMKENGFLQNGVEQEYRDLHVYPVDYFCPRQTTGEDLRSVNTYSDHLGLCSWAENKRNWKARLLSIMSPKVRSKIIRIKRNLIG